MRDLRRMQGEGQYLLTRGQLGALGFTGLGVCALAFFVGMAVGRGEAPETAAASTSAGLIPADIENDALVELLARVESAAARQVPEAQARDLTYPEALVAVEPEMLEVPAPEAAMPEEPVPPPAEDPLAQVLVPASGAPEAPPLSPVAPPSGWSVQLFSYPDSSAADAKVEELKALGLPAFRADALVKGSNWYRVKAGPFADPAQAEAAGPELAERSGADDWLVTPP